MTQPHNRPLHLNLPSLSTGSAPNNHPIAPAQSSAGSDLSLNHRSSPRSPSSAGSNASEFANHYLNPAAAVVASTSHHSPSFSSNSGSYNHSLQSPQVDIATYVSSIRPPLSPIDPTSSSFGQVDRNSSTSQVSSRPSSPSGLHKRRSKSITSKAHDPTNLASHFRSSCDLASVSNANLLASFPPSPTCYPITRSSDMLTPDTHSAQNLSHSLSPLPDSSAAHKHHSFQVNDDSHFTSRTFSHAIATTIAPASQASFAQIRNFPHGQSDDHSPDPTLARTQSTSWSNPAPPDSQLNQTTLRKKNTLSQAANLLRSASRRVVNLSGAEQHDHIELSKRQRSNTIHSPIELQDAGPSTISNRTSMQHKSDSDDDETHQVNFNSTGQIDAPLKTIIQLKGRTIGIFGPHHPLRLRLFRLFHSGVIDPLIFILIILDAVILTIQSSKSVWVSPRPTKGYFHSWEDRVLFILFCVFTLETVARIIVSGLILNPASTPAGVIGGSRLARGLQARTQQWLGRRKEHSISRHLHIRPPAGRDGGGWLAPTVAYGDDTTRVHPLDFPPTVDCKSDYTPPASSYPLKQGSPSYSLPPYAQRDRKDSQPSSFMKSPAPFRSGIQRQHHQLVNQIAYLRQSWNRMDFVAVVSFWISFLLATTGAEASYQIYVFRALSVLRLMRLLTITSGTTRILNSLKRASPLLVNVIFFVLFASSLFSIVGVQSFKGSFDRHCVWLDPAGQANYTFDSQSCGGQYNQFTGAEEGFVQSATQRLFGLSKGYLCPQGQLCMETGNPNNGTQNFDNVAGAAMQVIIIASANTWSNMMYSLMDAEYYMSCAFFIVCLLVLNFWLLNILVAVITNTFAEIMDETKHSAFAVSSAPLITGPETVEDVTTVAQTQGRKRQHRTLGWMRWLNEKLYYPWVLVVLVQFSFQASRSAEQTTWKTRLDQIESYFTIVFDAEILLRLIGYLPDHIRDFFLPGTNLADTGLAVVTSVIQLPFIKRSEVYPWLTVFQIARFYRVIVAFPRTGNLLKGLRGSFYGLVNMILFLLGMNFFAALLASQLLRGVIPSSPSTEMTFHSLWNSFLAMYQIFSSENWTTVLYSAMAAQAPYKQAFISGIMIACWFLFSNFVLLQMFIAVISEGFAVAEEQKRKEQIRALVNRSKPQRQLPAWFLRLNPYKDTKSAESADGSSKGMTLDEDDLPSEGVLPVKKSVLRDFLQPKDARRRTTHENESTETGFSQNSFVGRARKAFLLDSEDGVLSDPKLLNSDITTEERAKAEAERQMAFLSMTPSQRQQYYVTASNEQHAREAEFIKAHPTYDKVFWFISQRNWLRQICQLLVEPAYGERIFGRPANKFGVIGFQLVVFATILGSVVVAAIATPVYKQHYFLIHGESLHTWFNLAEAALGIFFMLEFVIKVIADGLIFTPNAYMLNTWNRIDCLVLITLITDITASHVYGGSTSRFTRSLKALRALRIINLSKNMRETFYNVLILGFGNLMDASVLTVMYIVPFAVWGQNIFAGLLYGCNDTGSNIGGIKDCVGEYVSAPGPLDGAPTSFNFLMPRAWLNPYVYSFDSFRRAVLILFEIISLEGWINVMTSLMSITGRDKQPQQDAAQWNAVYSLVYNLFGATIVLTLFLAVIINSFLKRSGSAFLTTEQQQWINLRRLILRQQPSKRPRARPQDTVRDWCYRRATQKHGWWSRMMTALYVVHVGLLMTLARSNSNTSLDVYRDDAFLALATVYLVDVLVALLGLGWISFQQNGWRIYDVIVIAGTFGTTVPIVIFPGQVTNVTIQFQKFFLVAIAFKLVQKNNELNQLFKTAVSSLGSIANVLGLWLVFFLVWGIMFVENFSLTRAGPTSISRNSNYQSLANALVMLAIQSTGEGWNTFMHDYTIESPYCISSPNFLFNDCGSAVAAYTLFITWNVISMYIVLNMFTGLVVDNFAYVFQLFGKVKAIDREEVRRFKEVWSEFDRERTGYIKRDQYIGFFAKLTGAFEVSVYPEELRVKALVASCSVRKEVGPDSKASSVVVSERTGDWMNVRELRRRLGEADWNRIEQRKEILNHLYQEALVTEKGGRGLSFTRMMMLLAHYKLIEDDQAMQLEELLDRRAMKQKVEELVKFEKIQGVLKMVVERRRFRRYRQQKLKEADGGQEQEGSWRTGEGDGSRGRARNVPFILIDNES